MPTSIQVLVCFAAAILFWTAIGLSLSRWLAPPALAFPIAPALGWVVHSTLALPLYRALEFRPESLNSVHLRPQPPPAFRLGCQHTSTIAPPRPASRLWLMVLAAVLATVVAIAAFPKYGDAVTLASPIFDHSKVAMIDEMVRLGCRRGNPFSAKPRHEARLVVLLSLAFQRG